MTANLLLTKSRILMIAAIFAASVLFIGQNDVRAYDDSQDVEMVKGDLKSVKVKNLSRVSITDPNVADIADAQTEEIMLMGKQPGETVMFIWDDDGKRTVNIRVFEKDLELVKARLARLIQKAEIKGVSLDINGLEGRVVVTGSLEEDDKEKMDKILDVFSDNVINMLKEKVYGEQIQIDVQITELNESLTKSIGFNWSAGGDDFVLGYRETLPETDGSPGDWFKIGDFNRTTAMLSAVNAFIREGKARILSKPRLVVVSGKEASFLVGGEIPFKTTTLNSTGGTVTEETTFKQYGVNMTITPTIKSGKIEIDLNVEVSDVDASNASGDEVAFVTRTATTHLNLSDGQTIVLAGLIKKSKSHEVKRLPFISKIPVVGLLFRSNSTPTPNQDTELVISLTPTILKDMMSQDKIETKAMTPPAAMKKEVAARAMPAEGNQVISAAYAQELQAKISSSINYPYEAKENGWEGTVKLGLHILKDGTLANVSIKESSGHSIFDEDAANTAKILAPYPPFSSDMTGEDVVVVIPIVYSQKSNIEKK